MAVKKKCPVCPSTGPWRTQAERADHIRGHHETTCPVCGQTVTIVGLDAHLRFRHPSTDDNTPPRAAPAPVGAEENAAAPAAPTRPPAVALTPAAAADPEPGGSTEEPTTQVECDICHRTMRRSRLARHRAGHRRGEAPPGAARIATGSPDEIGVGDVLAELVPAVDADLLAEITVFVERQDLQRARFFWLVAPLDGGEPRLSRTPGVGAQAERRCYVASLVIPLGTVYDRLHHTTSGTAAGVA